jgi:hypothetical protein
MRGPLPFPIVAVLLLAACGGGRDVIPEAEALAAAGKLEEAAAKLDVACALAAGGPRCAEADRRAFEVRMKAAEAAIAEGRFVAAARLLRQAALTADDEARKRAEARLAQDDLTAGLRCERALALPDKQKALTVLGPLASAPGPAGAKAKAWLDKEKPALLARAVKAACGPGHDGSCSEAALALTAAGVHGAEVDEAMKIAEAEKRRITPLRAQAEGFLRVFASLGKKRQAFDDCVQKKAGEEPTSVLKACDDEAYGTDPDDKKLLAQRNNEDLFRRLLKKLADPALARDYEARRAHAIVNAEVPPAGLAKADTAGRSP